MTEELEKRKAAQTKAQETVDDLKAGLETFISELEEEKSENIGVQEEKKPIEYAVTTAQQVIGTRENDKSAAAEATRRGGK